MREGNAHPGFVLIDGLDVLAEDVLHRVPGGLDQDSGQFASQYLQFGCRSVTCEVADRKLGDRAPRVIKEPQTDLAGARGADQPLNTHALQHFPSRPADIDILPVLPQGQCTFDHRRCESATMQPEREGGADDAGTADQNGSIGDGNS